MNDNLVSGHDISVRIHSEQKNTIIPNKMDFPASTSSIIFIRTAYDLLLLT